MTHVWSCNDFSFNFDDLISGVGMAIADLLVWEGPLCEGTPEHQNTNIFCGLIYIFENHVSDWDM
jgi:hypothetical protein